MMMIFPDPAPAGAESVERVLKLLRLVSARNCEGIRLIELAHAEDALRQTGRAPGARLQVMTKLFTVIHWAANSPQ
jgi:hypothetical protein